jgi:hypothetical protein
MDHEIQTLDRQFKRAFDEIDLLQNKIDQQRGILFVRYHTFSQEALLQSKHHDRVYSIVGTISSNIENWEARKKISEKIAEAYYSRRAEIDEKLQQLNVTIINREPTWWESFGFVCEKFRNDVMSRLPAFVRWAIETAIEEMSGGVFRSLFGVFTSFLNGSSEQKLLSESKNNQVRDFDSIIDSLRDNTNDRDHDSTVDPLRDNTNDQDYDYASIIDSWRKGGK